MKELLRISRAMKQANVTFIVGEARSGTSLLYRTLQKHPSFRPSVQNLVETDPFGHWKRTFMFSPTYPDPFIRFMLGNAREWNSFLQTIRPLQLVSAAWLPLNYLLRDRVRWLWYANLYHLVLRAYFFHAWQARGCDRLVEKTPTNTMNLARLALTFPRARFVYIHRHPIDVFTSYRRRAEVDPQASWAGLSLDQFCREFMTRTRAALEWRESRPETFHMVRYETLTTEPQRAFQGLCTFLDERFVPEALVEEAPDHQRWPVDPHLWSSIVPRTKRWEDYLTPDEAVDLQRRLAPAMRALGYEEYLYR